MKLHPCTEPRLNAPLGRLASAKLRALALAASALAVSLAAPTTAQAAALYANFDPGAAVADYSTTEYADISGTCGNYFCTGWLNIRSAGFDFVAEASGTAAYAYLPLHALYTYPGMERFYRIGIYNTAGELVVQGGLLGRHVGIGDMAVYSFELNRDYESGQVLAASGELVAGETYTAYFQQRFGSLSGTHWMMSDEAALPGQATEYCSLNTGGGVCVENWGAGWVYPYGTASQKALSMLPALALADGAGFTGPGTPPSGTPVPLPGTLALAGIGLAALSLRRRT